MEFLLIRNGMLHRGGILCYIIPSLLYNMMKAIPETRRAHYILYLRYIYISNGPAVCQWCGFKSRQGKNKKLTALRSNSDTVWFNFQTYTIFSINLVSLVALRSSGTDILYGCHLLLNVCIIYFISCDCIMNSSLSYTIY